LLYDGRVPDYRPQQRKVLTRIFTNIGWIAGTIHCSVQQSVIEYLNQQASFYKLTDVRLPGTDDPLSFFALQRERVILIAPSQEELNLEKPLPAGAHEVQVACVLDEGIITGRLRWAMHARLSDYLINHHGFFVLRDCTVRGRGESRGTIKRLPIALLNDRGLVGVSEFNG
jgi:hypothetical protein